MEDGGSWMGKLVTALTSDDGKKERRRSTRCTIPEVAERCIGSLLRVPPTSREESSVEAGPKLCKGVPVMGALEADVVIPLLRAHNEALLELDHAKRVALGVDRLSSALEGIEDRVSSMEGSSMGSVVEEPIVHWGDRQWAEAFIKLEEVITSKNCCSTSTHRRCGDQTDKMQGQLETLRREDMVAIGRKVDMMSRKIREAEETYGTPHANLFASAEEEEDEQANLKQNRVQRHKIPIPPTREDTNTAQETEKISPPKQYASAVKQVQKRLKAEVDKLTKWSPSKERSHGSRKRRKEDETDLSNSEEDCMETETSSHVVSDSDTAGVPFEKVKSRKGRQDLAKEAQRKAAREARRDADRIRRIKQQAEVEAQKKEADKKRKESEEKRRAEQDGRRKAKRGSQEGHATESEEIPGPCHQ
ncbi:hypothetical protein GE061_008479, partial [Apolygus lucorum]